MAAPSEVTLRNLGGQYVMNKKLSDDVEPILILQGVSWWMRRAIAISTVTLYLKEYVDAEGVTCIDIEQVGTGGFKGTTENRRLNGESREHEDHIFGKVRGRSWWIQLSDVQDEFLKNGWLPEIYETEAIRSFVESVNNGWTAEQIWGFEDINGERRYVRHVVVIKGDQRIQARLVYDYRPS